MARGRSRGRPRKGEEEIDRPESSNAFEALEELQDLGFSQEEVVDLLWKVKNDEAVTRITEEVEETLRSEKNQTSKRRSWADVVEEGEKLNPESKESGSQVEKQKQTWAEIAKANRDPQNGIALRYVKPGEVVKFSYEELQSGAKLWNNSLVGMVIGASPSYIEVTKYVRTAWQDKGLGRVHQLRKGVFLFDFKTEEDRNRIMEGFWAIYGRYPLLLKPWQAGKGVDEHFDKIPIWIQLPHLNLDLWEPENLGKVASYVGNPITTDACTAARSRVDYARVMVEVPFMGKLPDTIPLQTGEEPVYQQPVVYEWKPVACGTCGWFGHDARQCKRKIREEVMNQIISVDVQGVANEKKEGVTDTVESASSSGVVKADQPEIVQSGEESKKERKKEKVVEDLTPKNQKEKEKTKQLVVSKTPIIQNLPADKSKKAWEVVGRRNGGKKSTISNG